MTIWWPRLLMLASQKPRQNSTPMSQPSQLALQGTWTLRRRLTTASDVYAYGVVLLELVTGHEAIDLKRVEEINLIAWAVIDPLLDYKCPKEAYTAMRMTGLAHQCAASNKDERPNMKDLVLLATLEPYLALYVHHMVPPKPKYGSRRSKADGCTSGSDTQESIPTDPSVEGATVALLPIPLDPG